MSDESASNQSSHHQGEMVIHSRVPDVRGAGKWDAGTGRYIPVSGGSRTRVPLTDDEHTPRYVGNVGLDAKLTGGIGSMSKLYSQLGGMPVVKGAAGSKLSGLVAERRVVIPVGEDELAI